VRGVVADAAGRGDGVEDRCGAEKGQGKGGGCGGRGEGTERGGDKKGGETSGGSTVGERPPADDTLLND